MKYRILHVLSCCLTLIFFSVTYSSSSAGQVYVTTINSTINPGTVIHLKNGIRSAEEMEAECLIVELDTPGGLVNSLREMVQDIMGSAIPVVVYVSPLGAQAASAGAFLTIAADIAVMAPGTNIGAAHPVSVAGGDDGNSTMFKKAENDLAALARSIAQERGRNIEWVEEAVRKSVSATSKEALKLGVIDFIAPDTKELISLLDGRHVKKGKQDIVLSVRDAEIVRLEPGLREKFLMIIADPNIAYVLMMIGAAGIYFELSHPGAMFPGVIGGIALVLSLFAMQALPVSVTGLLLVALALLFFVLELFIISHGILGTAGVISLIFGSVMLFDAPSTGIYIDPEVLWTVVAATGGFMSLLAFLAAKATVQPYLSGSEGMQGEEGITLEETGPDGGKVFVHGEIWKAESSEVIPADTPVFIESLKGMKLRVSRIPSEVENV